MIKLMGIVTGKPKVNETLDIQPIADKIAKLTDRNDHTGSVLELATFLHDTQAIKLLQAVQQIHQIEGSMPSEISKYRENILKKLMDKVKSKYGPEGFKTINASF